MSHGLQVFSPSGQLALDVSETITRLHLSVIVPLPQSGSRVWVSVPGMNRSRWFVNKEIPMGDPTWGYGIVVDVQTDGFWAYQMGPGIYGRDLLLNFRVFRS